ncbi:MAG: DUF3141 domain-containing protein [Hyphomicrobiales bacterium]|nr:DUF3141 domain-containing protein [Hyphomicrobiales bacterium]
MEIKSAAPIANATEARPEAFLPSVFPWTDASKTPMDPVQTGRAFQEYMTDAWQRTILFLDVLRERGKQQAEITSRRIATVLKFDYEILMNGAELARPINYALARIVPPEGVKIDPTLRPVVIVDPRAGQGPGIGGFHQESEMGDALAAGHQVYFIGFAAEPIEGQTFLDVVEGQVKFFERVVDLHPKSPRPFAVGNCQAGYQTLMVAMLRPDLFGPILMPGSPLSYWQGTHGKNPMRYAGGLLGGSWLTTLTSDLGNGKFDGAYLVQNFDQLNPGNTAFSKLYSVYKAVDTEGPRFLGFEKWWGDFIELNGEEMQYLVDNHFVGDKLVRNEIATADGRLFDIRNVTSPIIVFTSVGDNISPPPQTLGWILDLYESVDDIRAQGKTIIYCINQQVGHLAIFVSPKVAAREHDAFMQTMDIIDILPPGLYELVLTEKKVGEPGADLVKSDFLARFEARTLADVRAFGRNSAEDDVAFATVARVSEVGLASYRTFLQPWVRSISNEQLAQAIRAMNPARLQYTVFAHDSPLMRWVADAANQVRAGRRPAASDNPFLALQEQMADAIVSAWNGFRDLRDNLEERTFFAIYNSPAVQSALGTGADVASPRKPPAKTSQEREAIAATLAGHRSNIAKGDRLEAAARALLYVLAADRKLDERVAFALRKLAQDHADIPIDRLKEVVRGQFFALELDKEQALRTLPAMIEGQAERAALARGLVKALGAAGTPSQETELRLETLFDLLGVRDVTPEPAAIAGPALAAAKSNMEDKKAAARAIRG